MSLLDMLLTKDVKDEVVKELKIKRLTEEFGEDAVFKIKTVNYNKIGEVMKMKDDSDVHIVLAGDAEGVFRSKELMNMKNAATPAELVKKVFQPGEVSRIAGEILKLSGYDKDVVEEIKKK